MKARPEEYLKLPYARILIPDENGTFSAQILEFPGCFSQGKTPDEAFRNLEEAANGWIIAALSQGQEIPAPSASHGYPGKIALRLPRSIHKRAAQLAQIDGTSLNQFLVSAIAARVGAEDLYARLLQKFEEQRAQAATWPMLTFQTASFSPSFNSDFRPGAASCFINTATAEPSHISIKGGMSSEWTMRPARKEDKHAKD